MAMMAISRLIEFPVALQDISGENNQRPDHKRSKPAALRFHRPSRCQRHYNAAEED
jgi:hypothetical protein